MNIFVPAPPPPRKRDVMQALIDRAEARVHLDARRAGVRLPQRLLGSGHVLLDYGYGLQPPIPDLVLDDEGIHATLSFSRCPFATFVPWSAVYLITDFDGNGAVWQEDIPADLLDAADAECAPGAPAPREEKPREPPPKKPRPSHLKLVK
ncbi:MAG TPA: ClpXP protease specificity-enhancing factor SspB [Casimicrobiaceae bacterium]|nr:ClpXP protease specificity-enhancing factor SspB [Casimicrobiaceae bacterium]